MVLDIHIVNISLYKVFFAYRNCSDLIWKDIIRIVCSSAAGIDSGRAVDELSAWKRKVSRHEKTSISAFYGGDSCPATDRVQCKERGRQYYGLQQDTEQY